MPAQAKKLFLVDTSMQLGCTCGKHRRCSDLLPSLWCHPSAAWPPWQGTRGRGLGFCGAFSGAWPKEQQQQEVA